MSIKQRTKIEETMKQLEEMWGHLDVLFDSLNESEGWNQKHGPDWIFADLPYHLAYLNRDFLGRPLEMGSEFPASEQELLSSVEELNAWNDRKLAQRPANQTVAESLQEMHASRDYLRDLTSKMTDEDLERPFWMSMFAGWTTAAVGLDFIRAHDWSEFIQLRGHMGRSGPVPSSAITQGSLNTILNFFPLFLNQEAAAGQEFTTVMAFTDPDVGAWTIRVVDGMVTVSQGKNADADLIITQSAKTFETTRQKMQSPADVIQSGQMQVSSFGKLAIFGHLFPV